MSYRQIDDEVLDMLIRHALRLSELTCTRYENVAQTAKQILEEEFCKYFSEEEITKRQQSSITNHWVTYLDRTTLPIEEMIQKALDFERDLWLDYVITFGDAQRSIDDYLCLIRSKYEQEKQTDFQLLHEPSPLEQQIVKMFDGKNEGYYPIFDYKIELQSTKMYYEKAFATIDTFFDEQGLKKLGWIYNPFIIVRDDSLANDISAFTVKHNDDNLFREWYSLEVRDNPFTKEELAKHLKLSDESIQIYFSLFKNLYCEMLLKHRLLSLCTSENYEDNSVKCYLELLSFVYNNNLLDEDTYTQKVREAYNGSHFESLFSYTLQVGVNDLNTLQGGYRIDTLEEYRMKIEEDLAALDDDWYLNAEYDCYTYYKQIDDDHKLLLYRFNDGQIHRLTLSELNDLLFKIKKSITELEQECNELCKSNFTKNVGSEESSVNLFDHDVFFDVVKQKSHIEKIINYLEFSKDILTECIEDAPNFVKICDSGNRLNIYKGNILCHQKHHCIEPTTAILYGKHDREIKISIEYCSDCGKFLLNNTIFEKYRKQYGILVGNFYPVGQDSNIFASTLALESPLHLSGYSVSQTVGLSTHERQLILARIIHNGIMSKCEVIRYLTYFINMNGAKVGNEIAVSKWEDDLYFVQNYDMSTQPETVISSIKKYK